MKTRNNLLGMLLFTASTLAFISCSDSTVAPTDELNLKSATMSLPTVFPDLVPGEEIGILLMREEEKMAHDVYVNFYTLWNSPVFLNISESETNHYNEVYSLISAYELTDPSTGVVGTFTNTEIAQLYTELIEKGTISLIGALEAGANIEEYDIIDLERLVSETENSALIQVYGNLLRGSRNHLRAFVTNLATYNVVYIPEVMDQASFDAIVNSPVEKGNQNGLQNGNGNKNGKGNGNGNGKGKGNSGNGNSSSRGTGNGTGTCNNG